jgi:hypothetical protein
MSNNSGDTGIPRIKYRSILSCGTGSSVGIVTGYGLDSPGIESVYVELSTRVVLSALTTGLVWEVEAIESE